MQINKQTCRAHKLQFICARHVCVFICMFIQRLKQIKIERGSYHASIHPFILYQTTKVHMTNWTTYVQLVKTFQYSNFVYKMSTRHRSS